jgi:hypothetical protein
MAQPTALQHSANERIDKGKRVARAVVNQSWSSL